MTTGTPRNLVGVIRLSIDPASYQNVQNQINQLANRLTSLNTLAGSLGLGIATQALLNFANALNRAAGITDSASRAITGLTITSAASVTALAANATAANASAKALTDVADSASDADAALAGISSQSTRTGIAMGNLQKQIYNVSIGLMQMGSPYAGTAAMGLSRLGSTLLSVGPGAAAAIVGIGGVTLVLQKLIEMYGTAETRLQNISILSKEMGLSAQEAAQTQALIGFTSNPTSPFAAITLVQVQAMIQNMADVKAGLIEADTATKRFIDAVTSLGIAVTDANGKARSFIDFTIDLNRAVQGLDAGRYTQFMRDIGGLFGKDYAAIVGTAPELLKKSLEQTATITQDMLDRSDEVRQAWMASEQAGINFGQQVTQALQPVDMWLQKVKQDVLGLWSGQTEFALGFWQQFGQSLNAIGNFGRLEELYFRMRQYQSGEYNQGWTYEQALMKQAEIEHLIAQIQEPYNTAMQVPAAQTGRKGVDIDQTRQMSQQAWDAMAKDWQKSNDALMSMVDKQAAKSLADATDIYKNSLKQLDSVLSDSIQLERSRIAANSDAITSFDKMMDSVQQATKSYDGYYKSLKDTLDKIDEIQAKANKTVEYATINGRPLRGTVQDVMDLSFEYQKLAAESTDEAQKQIDMQERLSARQQDIADRAAKAAEKGKPPPVVTATTEVAMANLQEQIARGGTSALEKVNDLKRQYDLAQQAAKLGFLPGEAITTENVGKAYGRAGYTPQMTKDLQDAYDRLKELNLQDYETQFNTARTAIQNFLTSIHGGDQKTFTDALNQMGVSLTDFAEASGLFESSGFVRAISEASLAAKLAAGGFGTGAEAVQNYLKAFKDFETGFKDLEKFISGSENITLAAAEKAGLVPTAVPGGVGGQEAGGAYNPNAFAEQTRIADIRARILKGGVSGAEVAQLWAQTQGLDIAKGVQQVFDISAKINLDKANELTDQYELKLKEIFDKTYDLKITMAGRTLDQMRDYVQQLITAIGLPGFNLPGYYSAGQPSAPGPSDLTWGKGGGIQRGFGLTPTQMRGPLPTVFDLASPENVEKLKQFTSNIITKVQDLADNQPIDIKSQYPAGTEATRRTELKGIVDQLNQFFSNYPVYVPVIMKMPKMPSFAEQSFAPQGTSTQPPAAIGPEPPFTGIGPTLPPDNTGGTGGVSQGGPNKVSSMTVDLPVANVTYNQTSSTNYVNVDARGSTNPAAVAKAADRAVRAAFLSDLAQYKERDNKRRRGIV